MAESVDAVSESAALPTPRRGLDPELGAEFAAADWKRVSPTFLWVDLGGSLLGTVVLTAASSIPFWLSGVWGLLAIPAAVLVTGLIVAGFTPRRVRAIGYRLRRDDFVVRRGIMFQRFAAVPYGRMQLVDINRGPLDRALGLAELKLVTAASASNVSVPGLPLADAEALRDRLVELAESRRAGL